MFSTPQKRPELNSKSSSCPTKSNHLVLTSEGAVQKKLQFSSPKKMSQTGEIRSRIRSNFLRMQSRGMIPQQSGNVKKKKGSVKLTIVEGSPGITNPDGTVIPSPTKTIISTANIKKGSISSYVPGFKTPTKPLKFLRTASLGGNHPSHRLSHQNNSFQNQLQQHHQHHQQQRLSNVSINSVSSFNSGSGGPTVTAGGSLMSFNGSQQQQQQHQRLQRGSLNSAANIAASASLPPKAPSSSPTFSTITQTQQQQQQQQKYSHSNISHQAGNPISANSSPGITDDMLNMSEEQFKHFQLQWQQKQKQRTRSFAVKNVTPKHNTITSLSAPNSREMPMFPIPLNNNNHDNNNNNNKPAPSRKRKREPTEPSISPVAIGSSSIIQQQQQQLLASQQYQLLLRQQLEQQLSPANILTQHQQLLSQYSPQQILWLQHQAMIQQALAVQQSQALLAGQVNNNNTKRAVTPDIMLNRANSVGSSNLIPSQSRPPILAHSNSLNSSNSTSAPATPFVPFLKTDSDSPIPSPDAAFLPSVGSDNSSKSNKSKKSTYPSHEIFGGTSNNNKKNRNNSNNGVFDETSGSSTCPATVSANLNINNSEFGFSPAFVPTLSMNKSNSGNSSPLFGLDSIDPDMVEAPDTVPDDLNNHLLLSPVNKKGKRRDRLSSINNIGSSLFDSDPLDSSFDPNLDFFNDSISGSRHSLGFLPGENLKDNPFGFDSSLNPVSTNSDGDLMFAPYEENNSANNNKLNDNSDLILL